MKTLTQLLFFAEETLENKEELMKKSSLISRVVVLVLTVMLLTACSGSGVVMDIRSIFLLQQLDFCTNAICEPSIRPVPSFWSTT